MAHIPYVPYREARGLLADHYRRFASGPEGRVDNIIICQVAAYYAYVNRLADGLGVELEERWTDEMMVLTREEFEVARGESR